MTNPIDPRVEAAARAVEDAMLRQGKSPDTHDLARAAIKAADAAAWQPIESAPKDGEEIILFCPQGDGNPGSEFRVSCGSYWVRDEEEDVPEGNYWHSWDGGFSEETMMPTHWMPLPMPPEATP